jgi:NAD(P)-dependent dehydrogenase (short-subunit alcohol dehydrogenase family)
MRVRAHAETMTVELQYPELAGKRVLVTGVAERHGAELARAFAGHRCRLVVETGGSAAHRCDSVQEIGAVAASLRALPADFSDAAGIDRFADAALKAYDGLDVLINVTSLPASAHAARSEAELTAAIGSAFRVPHRLTERALERMRTSRAKGAVLNILVETIGEGGGRALALHAFAKAALEAMTRGQAQAAFDAGCRVYGLIEGRAPGPRDWQSLEQLAAEPLSGGVIDSLPGMALFLASSRGGWLNGATLAIGA